MEPKPSQVLATVRGWDVLVAVFAFVPGMSLWSLLGPSVWAVQLGLVVVWYYTIGRFALRSGHPRLEVVFFVGMIALIGWSEATGSQLAVLQAIVLPMVFWVYWPSRRKTLAWSAAIVAAAVIGTATYVLFGAGASWNWATRLINLVLVPVVVLVVVWIAAAWASDALHWGRNRIAMIDELRLSQEQALALEREAAIVGEHTRLTQEVHDTIAQNLAGVRMLVAQARRQEDARQASLASAGTQEAPSGSVGATLDLVAQAVDTVVAQTHELIAATSSVPVESLFRDTVLRITSRFAADTGITVDSDVTPERLPRVTEVVFVRCIQEALSMIPTHAKASRVSVTVHIENADVVLTMTDDGVGIPTNGQEVLNLLAITERVTQAGGSFAVEAPGPSLGVTMRVTMPARAPKQEVTR